MPLPCCTRKTAETDSGGSVHISRMTNIRDQYEDCGGLGTYPERIETGWPLLRRRRRGCGKPQHETLREGPRLRGVVPHCRRVHLNTCMSERSHFAVDRCIIPPNTFLVARSGTAPYPGPPPRLQGLLRTRSPVGSQDVRTLVTVVLARAGTACCPGPPVRRLRLCLRLDGCRV